MAQISIEAKQGVYLLYKNYPYDTAQVFGEYIDNAIQSSEENILGLTAGAPAYKLRVDINIEWAHDPEDNVIKAKTITIQDNAAGMNSDKFSHAFNLADDSESREGMNEFGVGMKAASAWLGNKWRVESTSIEDNTTRILEVDLTEVSEKQIKTLESEEIQNSGRPHGTKIEISELWKWNAIHKDAKDDLIKNISSIYRHFIRQNEIEIYFEETLLTFEDYPVLNAPWYKTPDGDDIYWKKSVSFDDHKGHKLSGFVALLREHSKEKRGVVFTRNKRVVLGFDPNDRTIGQSFTGQVGSPKYRRVFGELEISGIQVTFGKNDVTEKKLLEALCQAVAGMLKINGYSLLTQGDKYKARRKSQKKSTTPSTDNVQPTSNDTVPSTTQTPVCPVPQNENPEGKGSNERDANTSSSNLNTQLSSSPITPQYEPITLASDIFEHNGKLCEIEVISSNDSDELFWNDISQASNGKLICKVNTEHPFFKAYGSPTTPMLTLFKALSIAKYKTLSNDGSPSDMMNEFNSIINTLNQ